MTPSFSCAVVLYTLGLCGLTALLLLVRRRRQRRYELVARHSTAGHVWHMLNSFEQPGATCVMTDAHLDEGAQCELCGVCVADEAMAEADASVACKPTSTPVGTPLTHHWVMACVSVAARCAACRRPCQATDLRCVWCRRHVHAACRDGGRWCDLGAFRRSLVPPNCVELAREGFLEGAARRRWVLARVIAPSNAVAIDWSPLLVVANRSSGGGAGGAALRVFRSLLNPAQVLDLAERTPEHGLEWARLLPAGVPLRLLVCGGDGTVCWLFKSIERLRLQPCPQVAILPLGTGNDLARVLGWGDGAFAESRLGDGCELLRRLEAARPVTLDRWQLELRPSGRAGGLRRRRSLLWNNYASIGVDALVTLQFHQTRQQQPMFTGHRLLNKLWYFAYGTLDLLERACKDLHLRLRVELDGVPLVLPPLEGLVVLNIGSWGGGCQPWSATSATDVSFNDGLFELMGLYSSFHIAQLQVGVGEPLRLGRGRHLKVTLLPAARAAEDSVPMQADGEPWRQGACQFVVSLAHQATVLVSGDA